MARTLIATAVLLATLLSACAGPGRDTAVPPSLEHEWERCLHPYPCGNEWPESLAARSTLKTTLDVRVPSHDGARLRGWIHLPDLPNGTRAPVILISSPYLADAPVPSRAGAFLSELIARGYAVALFSIRGTGGSEGCFEKEGPNERKDQAVLIDYLSRQPWANGRVGMYGLSYDGQTQVQAITQSAPALKTIVAGAVETVYLYYATPQGAFSTNAGPYEGVRYVAARGAVPDLTHEPSTKASRVVERTCPALVQNLGAAQLAQLADDRDAAFWNARDYYSSYPDATAAILFVQGFDDPWVYWGQDAAWQALGRAPKRFFFGAWGHEFPPNDSLAGRANGENWTTLVIRWYDFWLKGLGSPPDVGRVDYQLSDRSWRSSHAWPPAESSPRALYLSGRDLSTQPTPAARTFRSSPVPDARGAAAYLCSDAPPVGGLAFVSPPLSSDTVIAGNPFALLRLQSDLPGGQVAVHLFSLDAQCAEARTLAFGAADLRFWRGGYRGADFATGRVHDVRIDLVTLAEAIPQGARLAAVVSHGGPLQPSDLSREYLVPGMFMTAGRTGTPYYPNLAVAGDSHLVVPVLDGIVGADPPARAYPARPFVPAAPATAATP